MKWAILGDHDLETDDEMEDVQIREVVRSILHPNYEPPSVYNDLGLYLLNASVQFNRFVLPVCLNTAEMRLEAKEAIAIGWGRTGSGIRIYTVFDLSM